MKNKLLAISFTMPPQLFPRATQVGRLLKTLSRDSGIQITVVHGSPSHQTLLDFELSNFYNTAYTLVMVPDLQQENSDSDSWSKEAFNTAKNLITKGNYSAMITFSMPWVDHLVGLKIKQELNLPWIAHFSDPLVDNIYLRENAKDSEIIRWTEEEEKVIDHCDKVSFTSQETLDLVMCKYPLEWKEKAIILNNCYDTELFPKQKNRFMRDDDILHIVHTGNLYSKRSALTFIKVIESLHLPIRVTFVGTTSNAHLTYVNEHNLSQYFHFRSPMPYLRSLEFAQSADVLLLVDALTEMPSPFLPSKLADYIMLEKPILGLTPKEGTSAKILQQLDQPCVSPEDSDSIRHAVLRLYQVWSDGELHYLGKTAPEVRGKFDVNSVATILEENILKL
ncbi:MAG: hypothetical protein JEZ06_21395 [Anaerolineaceae bacterium]|nr:hypothetical protein [Anaerolineaceae bacterium]